jgi:predicted ATPase/DNA-binding SARP family transcriptional activator
VDPAAAGSTGRYGDDVLRRRDPVALPRPLTSLIGRERDLDEVATALMTARLLTLTGPGGVGKTRLALTLAALRCTVVQTYWVDVTALSSPGSPEDIVAAICLAAGLPDVSRSDGVARLAAAFDQPPALLLLDNAEHLVRACGEVVDALLRLCPALQIMVTSREPLGVEGEHVYRVGPLAVPDPDDPADPTRCGAPATAVQRGAGPAGGSAQDALDLFVHRARAVDRGFELTDENWPAVLAICRAMAGVPLGIELAAAQVAAIGIRPVAAVLTGRALPAGPAVPVGPDAADPTTDPQGHRQRTVAASLGWSYDLLPGDQATLFRRLSVFPGSFDLAAAAAVAGDPTGEGPVARTLALLVEKSMVVASDRDGETWYRLLAPLQLYAAERLAESGDRDDAVTAHLAYVTRLAERLGSGGGPESLGDLDRLEGALPDIRAALAAARQAHEVLVAGASVPGRAVETRVTLGVRLAGLLVRLCYLRGHYQEGEQWLEWAVRAGRGGAPESLAAALRGAGRLAFLRCDYPLATVRLREALDLTIELDDQAHVIETLLWLGSVARETGDYPAAEALCARARDLAAAVGDEWSVGRADNYLAFTAWLRGRFEEAVERCRSTMDAAARIGDTDTVIWSMINMGAARLYQGDLMAADDLLHDAMDRSEQDRFAEGVAWSRHLLGVLLVRRGDRLGALGSLRSALSAHQALEDRWRVTSVLDDLAGLAAVAADGIVAARFLGAADALRRHIGVTPAPVEQDDRRVTLRLTRGLLRGKDFDAEFAAGAAADVQELARTLGPVPRADDLGGPVGPDSTVAGGTAGVGSGGEDGVGDDATPTPDGGGLVGAARDPGDVRDLPGDPAADRPERLPALDIKMLGAATVRVNGRLLRGTDFGYAKPRELLFFLAARGPATKEAIGDALWPDSPPAKVKGALHTALRELRRAVGSTSLIGLTDDGYLLHPDADLTSDLADFRREAAAAGSEDNPRQALPRLRRAIGLYGGEFLDGTPRPPWAERVAGELRDRYRGLLLGLGRALSQQGRWASATEAFLHAVHHDPDDAEARRLLVAAWAGVADGAETDRHDDAADAVPDEAQRWLIELARNSPSFRVTATRSGTRLYQELVRRRRSAAVEDPP